MIADSTYDVGELISRPRAGTLAGGVAAAVMLALLAALEGPNAVGAWLGDVARVMLPAPAQTPISVLSWGLFVHFAAGGLFGALYAACQQHAPTSGLVVVGGFYGFVLWLGGDLILVRLLRASLPLLQGWSGLLMYIAYGLTLAAWAARAEHASARLRRDPRPID
jgi:hypothetical protein